jgi:phosphoenolpyruvate carboxylase
METVKTYTGIAGGTPERLSNIIEQLLDASKNYFNAGTPENFDTLASLVAGIENEPDLLEVARVFHEFLILAELAERQHRIRRWRAYRRGNLTLFYNAIVCRVY